MKRIFAILLLLACNQKPGTSSKTSTQLTFDTTTRQIFFNAKVDKSSKDLVEFYKSSEYLTLNPPQKTYTLYPPLSALGQDSLSEQYSFRFKTHPYLSFKFREGDLLISKTKSDGKERYSPPTLKFIFDTQEQSELAYKELVDIYSKLSTRKRFSNYKDRNTAEFTDDKSTAIRKIHFVQAKADIFVNGYLILFGLGNDTEFTTDNYNK
jgi:hypothetical protein